MIDGAQHGGLPEEGDDEEGGMVTGKSAADITGRRNNTRGTKKTRRKDRPHDPQRQGEAEEDDSSDLSDESDEDGDAAQRSVDSVDSGESSFSHLAGLRRRSSSRKYRYGQGRVHRQYALRIVTMGQK